MKWENARFWYFLIIKKIFMKTTSEYFLSIEYTRSRQYQRRYDSAKITLNGKQILAKFTTDMWQVMMFLERVFVSQRDGQFGTRC